MSDPIQDSPASRHRQHRWSGWPGAWCLDCGIEDPWEIELAEGNIPVDEVPKLVEVPECPVHSNARS